MSKFKKNKNKYFNTNSENSANTAKKRFAAFALSLITFSSWGLDVLSYTSDEKKNYYLKLKEDPSNEAPKVSEEYSNKEPKDRLFGLNKEAIKKTVNEVIEELSFNKLNYFMFGLCAFVATSIGYVFNGFKGGISSPITDAGPGGDTRLSTLKPLMPNQRHGENTCYAAVFNWFYYSASIRCGREEFRAKVSRLIANNLSEGRRPIDIFEDICEIFDNALAKGIEADLTNLEKISKRRAFDDIGFCIYRSLESKKLDGVTVGTSGIRVNLKKISEKSFNALREVGEDLREYDTVLGNSSLNPYFAFLEKIDKYRGEGQVEESFQAIEQLYLSSNNLKDRFRKRVDSGKISYYEVASGKDFTPSEMLVKIESVSRERYREIGAAVMSEGVFFPLKDSMSSGEISQALASTFPFTVNRPVCKASNRRLSEVFDGVEVVVLDPDVLPVEKVEEHPKKLYVHQCGERNFVAVHIENMVVDGLAKQRGIDFEPIIEIDGKFFHVVTVAASLNYHWVMFNSVGGLYFCFNDLAAKIKSTNISEIVKTVEKAQGLVLLLEEISSLECSFLRKSFV
ncbi:MAG: hypothetical protein LBK29_00375 [Oscillospiraceae bacterium]|jgi:hypothetical protein|nr:hypothetical protein [Oscillospiraceae bacterium]